MLQEIKVDCGIDDRSSIVICKKGKAWEVTRTAKQNLRFLNQGLLYEFLLTYEPYGPERYFIAKLLRKSPYEGRARWREEGRKKPSMTSGQIFSRPALSLSQ